MAADASTVSRAPTTAARTLAYQPALDGVRAVAVTLVLLFHHGVSWMSGGYVGVSVFFTLSGFLITRLLLDEHARTGTIDLGAFYGRRLRRLLPASLLCLTGVALWSWLGGGLPTEGLRTSILAALGQVANWESLARDTTYGRLLTGGATPVDHFWSLSVEEQFYWAWPLAMILVLRRTRGGRTLAFVAAAAVAAAPVVAAVWGPDAAYWATPARLGEILTGAALAEVTHRRGPAAAPAGRRWLGWPAGGLIVLAAVTLPSDRGPAYQGLLGVGSLVTVALLWSLQHEGTLRRVLSVRPLVALGRVSYGVYLAHWPIFLAVRPGQRDIGTLAIRSTLTLAIAVLSYTVVERPIRTRTWRLGVTAGAAAMASGVVVALVAGVVPVDVQTFSADAELTAAASIAPVEGTLAPLTSDPVGPSTSVDTPTDGSATSVAPDLEWSRPNLRGLLIPASPTPSEPPPRPVRILVVGDSTASLVASGLIAWAVEHPELAQVTSIWNPGCGFLRHTRIPSADDDVWQRRCDDIIDRSLPDTLDRTQPDIVLLLSTLGDVIDREWSVDEGVLTPLDEAYARHAIDSYRLFAAQILDRTSARIVWLTPAPPAPWYLGYWNRLPDDPRRWDPLRRAIAAVSSEARVVVVDFGTWLRTREIDGSRYYRSDGLHLSEPASLTLATDDLGPGLVTIALGAITEIDDRLLAAEAG